MEAVVKRATVRRDKRYHDMYRVHWPDDTLSDMVNHTRAAEAARQFNESEERRLRGRRTLPGDAPIDLNRERVSE